ncbi:hypothetical protein Plhal304r1_c087g0169761 [Plasmopara halstedii]
MANWHMTKKTTATAAALVGILAARQVSGHVHVSVQYDATYSLSESCGLPCSGSGEKPVGNACPKAGDIATANCQPHLPSYNGAMCVAPVDAHCVLIRNNVWGCAFSSMEYTATSKTEDAGAVNEESWGWPSNYKKNSHVKDGLKDKSTGYYYDTNLDTPLDINCDVVTEMTNQQTGGTMERSNYHGHQKPNTMKTATMTSVDDGTMNVGYPSGKSADGTSIKKFTITSEDVSTSTMTGASRNIGHSSGGHATVEHDKHKSEEETIRDYASGGHTIGGHMTDGYTAGEYAFGDHTPKEEKSGTYTAGDFTTHGITSGKHATNQQTTREHTTGGATHETIDDHPVPSGYNSNDNYESLTATAADNTATKTHTTDFNYDTTGTATESATSSGGYFTDTHDETSTEAGTAAGRYEVGTAHIPSESSTVDGQHYYLPKKHVAHYTTYTPTPYVRGSGGENKQTYDHTTYGSFDTKAAEPYAEPLTITEQITQNPTKQIYKSVKHYTPYVPTEKPCDTDAPEEGTSEPATDEVQTEPVVTLPPITLPPVTLPILPPVTLPPITLPPVTLPTLPPITLPPVTLPTLPPITLPPVTLPLLPPVTLPPTLPLPPLLLEPTLPPATLSPASPPVALPPLVTLPPPLTPLLVTPPLQPTVALPPPPLRSRKLRSY